jgi:hypothetical protein
MFFSQIRSARAACEPVWLGGVLPILAFLVDEICCVHQVPLSKPGMIVIVVAPWSILFGQGHLLKSYIQIRWCQMHLPDDGGLIAAVP